MDNYLNAASEKSNLTVGDLPKANEKDYKKNVKIVSDEIFKEIQQGLNDPSWLLYIDAAALYSGIKTKYLSYKDLKWEESTHELLKKILKTNSKSEIGYFIECDLEYPDSIKHKTRYYPLAPTKRKIKYKELLDWQKESTIKKILQKN